MSVSYCIYTLPNSGTHPPARLPAPLARQRQGRAGQDRAGQDRAGQGRAGGPSARFLTASRRDAMFHVLALLGYPMHAATP